MKTTTSEARPVESGCAGSPPGPMDAVIKNHPFLKDMSPHQQRILADCAMFSQFATDELILREGDPANRFYLIQKGRVALEAHAEEQGIIPIQTLESGDVLGWSWLFPPYFWRFDGRALEPTEAIFFYGTALREECEADHDLGYELMRRMAEVMERRLQATRKRLLSVERLVH